jgi:hypothetical protein
MYSVLRIYYEKNNLPYDKQPFEIRQWILRMERNEKREVKERRRAKLKALKALIRSLEKKLKDLDSDSDSD